MQEELSVLGTLLSTEPVAVGTDGPVELTCYRASIEGEVADDDDVIARHPEPSPLLLLRCCGTVHVCCLSMAWARPGGMRRCQILTMVVWAALGALGREGKADDSCSPAGRPCDHRGVDEGRPVECLSGGLVDQAERVDRG